MHGIVFIQIEVGQIVPPDLQYNNGRGEIQMSLLIRQPDIASSYSTKVICCRGNIIPFHNGGMCQLAFLV